MTRHYEIVETRKIEVVANNPEDAARIASARLRGEIVHDDIEGFSRGKVTIISLEIKDQGY